jgi:hypothetical protein
MVNVCVESAGNELGPFTNTACAYAGWLIITTQAMIASAAETFMVLCTRVSVRAISSKIS